MDKIPAGYTLLIVDPLGNVVTSIDIGGYNLGKPAAKAFLSDEIARAVQQNGTVDPSYGQPAPARHNG